VFLSPVVFTPQVGKDMTKLYLNAAGGVFDSESDSGASDDAGIENLEKSAFRYTKEIASGHHAMLEFESQIEGKYVNGVDILSCDDDGKIIEFKVMIRPLQAVNAIHQQMMQMLERMKQ